ncbi:amino acid decarboxylase [candidate division TA06 bacterium SM23_40]|uniref:Amino acid decarboxylase n=1 Tax=candidate division TA06 bacterium SM23_40 TaxID=1703774 RepID=A0A0S8G3G9_UNCT6|nr:MAG: amino acid decarboxylase [candidate division TA06 bacterium SM23_40]
MPVEDFRTAGYRVIDWIADYLEKGPRAPILSKVEPGEVTGRLSETAPPEGSSFDEIFRDFGEIIYPGLTHWNSPRYMAYFPSSASGPAILGELLAAGTSQNAMAWRTSPSGTELELRVMDWLRDLLGLPGEFHGHIVDTASISTMLALAAAREAHRDLQIRTRGAAGRSDLPPLTVYASEEAHSSVDKSVITLGYGQEQLRKIPTDNDYRMISQSLHDAIRKDRDAGFHPLAVVATVGTTSSTSIDPVAEIADICQEYDLWLHVDAAYGGVAAIVPEKRHILDGCDRADSLVVNPHKWLFTPMDCSAFFVRRPEVLKATFSLIPEYLSSERDSEEAVTNLMDYGIQLGRRFRSLKLWMVLRYFGADGMAERLRYHMTLADRLAGIIEDQPGVELMAPVNFATVCFRFHPGSLEGTEEEIEARLEELNSRIMAEANATGEVFLSHTKLKDQYTLRLVFGHLRTTGDDVREVWELLTRLAEKAAG